MLIVNNFDDVLSYLCFGIYTLNRGHSTCMQGPPTGAVRLAQERCSDSSLLYAMSICLRTDTQACRHTHAGTHITSTPHPLVCSATSSSQGGIDGGLTS